MLSLKGFLQVFDQIVALTNGGPGTATESVTLLIFRGGFTGGEFAYQIGERGDLLHRDHDRLAASNSVSFSAERPISDDYRNQRRPAGSSRSSTRVTANGRRRRQGDRDDDTRKTNWWATALIAVCSLTVLIPLYLAVVVALKTPAQLTEGTGFELPNPIRWENFAEAWERTNFPQALANTAIITVGVGGLHAADELDRRLRASRATSTGRSSRACSSTCWRRCSSRSRSSCCRS